MGLFVISNQMYLCLYLYLYFHIVLNVFRSCYLNRCYIFTNITIVSLVKCVLWLKRVGGPGGGQESSRRFVIINQLVSLLIITTARSNSSS